MTNFGQVWDSSASGNSNLFPGTFRRKRRPSNWLHRRFYRVVYPGPSKLYATLLAGAKVHAEGGRTDSTQRVTSDALHIVVTFLEFYFHKPAVRRGKVCLHQTTVHMLRFDTTPSLTYASLLPTLAWLHRCL